MYVRLEHTIYQDEEHDIEILITKAYLDGESCLWALRVCCDGMDSKPNPKEWMSMVRYLGLCNVRVCMSTH